MPTFTGWNVATPLWMRNTPSVSFLFAPCAPRRLVSRGVAPDELRVRKRVDRDLDRIAQMQPHDVGLVDLHLGLNDREIRDREQQTGFARERSGHRDLALLDGEPRDAPRHGSDEMGLRE